MKTLTLAFSQYALELRLTGLSLKALDNVRSLKQAVYICDITRQYCIDLRFDINPKTAHIERTQLIKYLVELYEAIPFQKIKFKNYYPSATADELLNEIKKQNGTKAQRFQV